MSRVGWILAMVLLAASVVVVWACIIGLVRSRGPFDRLHFAGAASLLGPSGVALAILFAGAPAASAVRGLLIAAILGASSSLVTHATARAEWLRSERLRRGQHVAEGEYHAGP